MESTNPLYAIQQLRDDLKGRRASIWDEDKPPVPFDEFVTSKEHLNFVPLSDRQYNACFALLYGCTYQEYKSSKVTLNPNIFENTTFQMAVICWGKGSGKDTLAALIEVYICYVLLKMVNPQTVLNLPNSEPIDILNVARSAAQAQTVFFTKVRQRIMNWQWLKKKFVIKVSGKAFNISGEESLPENTVQVNINTIEFPKVIRLFSKHSQEESYEGLNPIFFLMDEASSLSDSTKIANAEKIYNVLNSSATTRFGKRAKGMAISYPRHSSDFTMRFYALSQKEFWIYGDKAATWEVKPRHFFSKETFMFEGHEIPMDFKKDFDRNPTDAKTKYLCLPPLVESAFIEYPEKVDLLVRDKEQLLIAEDLYQGDYVRKQITSWRPGYRSISYAITVDLGLSDCESAICISHKEKNKLIVDYIDSWVPITEQGNFIVDIDNVFDFIVACSKRITISHIRADRWNSAMLLQKLKSLGLPADDYSLSYLDYKRLQDAIYQDQLEIPRYEKLIKQIKSLQISKGNKVDRSSNEYKDLCDVVTGGLKIFFDQDKALPSEDGEYISENLQSLGGTFIRGTF